MLTECVCKHVEVDESFTISPFGEPLKYERCTTCLTYRMINPPTLPEIVTYYNNEKSIRLSPGFNTARKATAQFDFESLQNYSLTPLGEQTKLLDIGCSEGEFVDTATWNKIHAQGIDIATELVAFGKSEGRNLTFGDYLQFTESDFSVITMHDVLEHSYTPRLYLEKAHKDLLPKGIIQITFPCYAFASSIASWEHARYDHNWLFSLYGLVDTLSEIGFELMRITSEHLHAYPGCVMILATKK